MSPSAEAPRLESLRITSSSGQLELLASLPQSTISPQLLLFVHGAFCSAACYKTVLPLLARSGYACFALSLRGHGKSWQPSAFAFHALTGIDSYVADVEAAVAFLETQYSDKDLVLIGHSMGGGVLQRALGIRGARQAQQQPSPKQANIAGLILLASAPLWGGGMDITRNWQAAEASLCKEQAATAPPTPPKAWLPWLKSFFYFNINTGVDTPAQVRNKFFSPEASDDVVKGWIRDSKSRLESIRVSFEIFCTLAEPGTVLAAIDQNGLPLGRKVLCISAEKDILITSEVSQKNFDAYHLACDREEEVLRVQLPGSSHHLALDIRHERCAEIIVTWLEGGSI
jgi:pimeloyl-ACP methyl ester carboxylesterase